MKRILPDIFAAALYLFAAMQVLPAQSVESVRFHAAKAFRVGALAFNTGDYTLRTLHTGSNTPVLYLEPKSGPGATILAERVPLTPAQEPPASQVQMQQVGEDVRLSGVSFAGIAYFYQLHSAAH